MRPPETTTAELEREIERLRAALRESHEAWCGSELGPPERIETPHASEAYAYRIMSEMLKPLKVAIAEGQAGERCHHNRLTQRCYVCNPTDRGGVRRDPRDQDSSRRPSGSDGPSEADASAPANNWCQWCGQKWSEPGCGSPGSDHNAYLAAQADAPAAATLTISPGATNLPSETITVVGEVDPNAPVQVLSPLGAKPPARDVPSAAKCKSIAQWLREQADYCDTPGDVTAEILEHADLLARLAEEETGR